MSYFYDLNEVLPSNKQSQPEEGLTLPLKVRDETIGKLVIQGVESNDSEAMSFINTVSERLGAHIENLRLSEQSQEKAQRERALRQITSAVRGSNDPAIILRSAARELGALLGRKTIVRVATSQTEHPANLTDKSVASNENESVSPATELPNADGGNE
jgi:GAF domain-containing protein